MFILGVESFPLSKQAEDKELWNISTNGAPGET